MQKIWENDSVTVDDVVAWAGGNGIDLGKNPKRTLIYLATNGVIPKTTKGWNCKGVYKRNEIFGKLEFYHNRRKEGWRIQDIAVAVSRLQSAQEESLGMHVPVSDVFKYRTDERLMSLPLADSFKDAFKEYLRRSPGGAENLLQYLEEQEAITGVRISEAFKRLIGLDVTLRAAEVQTKMNF